MLPAVSQAQMRDCELPKIYNKEVKSILKNLRESLSLLVDQDPVYDDQMIARRESHMKQKSWLYYLVPKKISLGNTYKYSVSSCYNQAKNMVYSEPSHHYSEDEKKARLPVLLIMTVALTVMGACCYYAGQAYGEMNAADQDIDDGERLQGFIEATEKQIKTYQTVHQEVLEGQLQELKKIECTINTFRAIKAEAYSKLQKRVALAAGAAIIAVGAYFSIVAVITAGSLISVGSIFAMLFSSGCNAPNRRAKEENQKNIDIIRNMEEIYQSLENERSLTDVAHFVTKKAQEPVKTVNPISYVDPLHMSEPMAYVPHAELIASAPPQEELEYPQVPMYNLNGTPFMYQQNVPTYNFGSPIYQQVIYA